MPPAGLIIRSIRWKPQQIGLHLFCFCVFFSFKISRKFIERPNINELVLHCLVAWTRFHTLKLTPEDHWDFVA